jgi:hypothetical protein
MMRVRHAHPNTGTKDPIFTKAGLDQMGAAFLKAANKK